MREVKCRRVVAERSGGRCEWCGRRAESMHHRLPGQMGGDPVDYWHPSRVIAVCGDGVRGCHGLIESRPRWVYDAGLLVRRSPRTPPGAWCATVPMLLRARTPVYLTPAGGYRPCPPEQVPTRMPTATPPGSGLFDGSDSPGAWPW